MSDVQDHDPRDDQDQGGNALQAFAGNEPAQTRGGKPRDDIEFAAAQLQTVMQSMDRVYGAQRVARFRDLKLIERQVLEMAGSSFGAWLYGWEVEVTSGPRKGQKDWVEGGTIKLADDILSVYLNLDIQTISLDLGPQHWLFLTRLMDLETGISRTRPYLARKPWSKFGKMAAERQETMTYQRNMSKAERNLVLHHCRRVAEMGMEAAKKVQFDKVKKNPDAYRERILEGLEREEINVKRLEAVLGKEAAAWNVRDIVKVLSTLNAIADGMISWDEAYPPIEPAAQAEPSNETQKSNEGGNGKPKTLDDVAAGGAQKSEPARASAEQGEKPADPGNGRRGAETQEMGTGSEDTGSRPAQQAAEPTETAGRSEPQGGSPEAKTGTQQAHSTKPSSQADRPAPEKAAEPAKAAPAPKNAREYGAHVDAWVKATPDLKARQARWLEEKALRNACKVGADDRDALKAFVDKGA